MDTNKEKISTCGSTSEKELTAVLQMLESADTIDIDDVCAAYKAMQKKKTILENHTSIWYSPSDDTWNTHIRVNGKRKLVKRKRKEDVEQAVLNYYRSLEDNPTIVEIYNAWIEERKCKEAITPQSADRYDNEFKRYFVKGNIAEVHIRDITASQLENFLYAQIKKQKLNRKAYGNLHTILQGILTYACKHGYTEIQPSSFFEMLDLDGMFTEKPDDPDSHVFKTNEIPMLKEYFLSKDNIWGLGCLLCLQTGIRVGELAALKPEDWIRPEKVLRIRRSEKKLKNDEGKWTVEVEEYPKTEAGNRDVILTDSAIETLEKIMAVRPAGEYLFIGRKGQRIRENTFNKHLGDAEDYLHLPHRSIHKTRATYGTTLLDGGCDDATITRQMGHKDVSTTRKYYYYCNKTRAEQHRQVENAISF